MSSDPGAAAHLATRNERDGRPFITRGRFGRWTATADGGKSHHGRTRPQDRFHKGEVKGFTKGMTDERSAIEDLARLWLASEREASGRGNSGGTEERARRASAAYEMAVTLASREDLLVAWHAALNVQHAQEMGSVSWSQAREVSELIRMEYLASE